MSGRLRPRIPCFILSGFSGEWFQSALEPEVRVRGGESRLRADQVLGAGLRCFRREEFYRSGDVSGEFAADELTGMAYLNPFR